MLSQLLVWWTVNVSCGCWVSPDGVWSESCRDHGQQADTRG